MTLLCPYPAPQYTNLGPQSNTLAAQSLQMYRARNESRWSGVARTRALAGADEEASVSCELNFFFVRSWTRARLHRAGNRALNRISKDVKPF